MDIILKGFLVVASLIMAIGAQNAFVLKQGILKNHILAVIIVCFLCDVVLISLGVLGLGSLITQSPEVNFTLSVLGALFLFVYGCRAVRSAISGNNQLNLSENAAPQSLLKTVLLTLMITLLNPHVYIDTVVVIGSIGGTLGFEDKLLFLVGALFASLIWFFAIGYGAALFAPLFKKPITWRILDSIIALIMFAIAFSLCSYAIEIGRTLFAA